MRKNVCYLINGDKISKVAASCVHCKYLGTIAELGAEFDCFVIKSEAICVETNSQINQTN